MNLSQEPNCWYSYKSENRLNVTHYLFENLSYELVAIIIWWHNFISLFWHILSVKIFEVFWMYWVFTSTSMDEIIFWWHFRNYTPYPTKFNFTVGIFPCENYLQVFQSIFPYIRFSIIYSQGWSPPADFI